MLSVGVLSGSGAVCVQLSKNLPMDTGNLSDPAFLLLQGTERCQLGVKRIVVGTRADFFFFFLLIRTLIQSMTQKSYDPNREFCDTLNRIVHIIRLQRYTSVLGCGFSLGSVFSVLLHHIAV